MNTHETLGDVIAALRSSEHAVNFIDGENLERRQTFAGLYDRAAGLLHHFQKAGAKAGDEVIILVDRNEQFIDAFWAGVLGNLTLVPVAPGNNDEHRAKLFRILAKLRHPFLCTDTAIQGRLNTFAAANGLADALNKIRATTILLDRIEDIATPGTLTPAKPDDIAFIQFSSGSTSEPKGVTLTHRNLLTNIRAISQGAAVSSADVALSWMPLTHDMGLIGFHLTLMFCDAEHFLMPTALFVRRPQLWLQKAAQHRASLLCSPNFGYRHFLKGAKPDNTDKLDLSAVRLLFNGAEPISAALCAEFCAALQSTGLKNSAMFPVYGLAEASLAVSFPQPGSGCTTVSVRRNAVTTGAKVECINDTDLQAATFVEVGGPVADCEVRIADGRGAALPDLTIGRVLIKGENVTRGYYRDDAATNTAIHDGWLDTGDLGFMRAGALTITGRAKDIIFVSGQNYYPHDIEALLEQRGVVEAGKIAICGTRGRADAADTVLAFVLHRADEAAFAPTVAAVRKTVNELVGIAVDHVIPIARMPKTTSGKIQRFKLAESYRDGEYNETLQKMAALSTGSGESDDGGNEIERNLKGICDELMKDKAIGLHDNIFELGTSSLTLAQIYERVEVIYPGQLEVTDFFDYPTIAELAKYLETRLNAAQV